MAKYVMVISSDGALPSISEGSVLMMEMK